MTLDWPDLAGLFGVALVLGGYLLVQMRVLDARGAVFLIGNTFGALLLLLSLLYAFNLSAFVIQCAWIAISLYGLIRLWRERGINQIP